MTGMPGMAAVLTVGVLVTAHSVLVIEPARLIQSLLAGPSHVHGP